MINSQKPGNDLAKQVKLLNAILITVFSAIALYFAYDQFAITHKKIDSDIDKMNRLIKDIDGVEYCTDWGDGTIERQTIYRTLLGVVRMKYSRNDGKYLNPQDYDSELYDVQPDPNIEYAIKYVIDFNKAIQGTHLIYGGKGIYNYETNNHRQGTEMFPCDVILKK